MLFIVKYQTETSDEWTFLTVLMAGTPQQARSFAYRFTGQNFGRNFAKNISLDVTLIRDDHQVQAVTFEWFDQQVKRHGMAAAFDLPKNLHEWSDLSLDECKRLHASWKKRYVFGEPTLPPDKIDILEEKLVNLRRSYEAFADQGNMGAAKAVLRSAMMCRERLRQLGVEEFDIP